MGEVTHTQQFQSSFFLKDHHLMETESSGETASFCFILLFKQPPCREADGLSYQGV